MHTARGIEIYERREEGSTAWQPMFGFQDGPLSEGTWAPYWLPREPFGLTWSLYVTQPSKNCRTRSSVILLSQSSRDYGYANELLG